MFLHRVIHFWENLGDKIRFRSPKKQKNLIAVPSVLTVIFLVLSFNVILMSSPYLVPRPSNPLLGTFGRPGKGPSTKKLKLLRRVPLVEHVKVHVLSFNLIHISSPWRVPRPIYPFRGNLRDLEKGRSLKKLNSLIEVL